MPTPSSMLAGRFHERGKISIDEVEVPALEKGEVRIKVAFAGICGSDLHECYEGPFTCCPVGSPHPLTGTTVPATLGHEFSGIVEEVGEGVDGDKFKKGTKVCVEPVISCRECENCKAGRRPLCDTQIGFYGYNRPGGLAPYVNVDERNVHIVPDEVSLDIAALAEPLSVAWHAVSVSAFKAGETALVIGAGPIGAAVVKVLKALGASKVFVSEPNETRRAIASECGADATFDPLKVDVVAELKAKNSGGVHVAIDCAGTQRTFDAAIDATKAKGRIVMVALWMPGNRPTIDMSGVLFKERVVTGSCCFTSEDMQAVLSALASGTLVADNLVTSRIVLQDLFEKGLEALRTNPAQVKILVDLEATEKRTAEGK